jgi:MFS family permease
MPLMLQLTFGFTPFESGLTTFVSAFGAILSKVLAERLYARFGFPRMLTGMAVLGTVFLAINGLFTPETPHVLLLFFLFMGGITRSFFFTGVNVFGYADVHETEASQATVISAVAQQISIALGVAVAGGLLEFTSRLHGGEPTLSDFHIAWFSVAGVAAVSALFFARLPPDAGADVSGHGAKPLPLKSDGIV